MFMLHVALELHSLSEDYGLESLEQFVKRNQSHALSLISLILIKSSEEVLTKAGLTLTLQKDRLRK